jgi:5'-nucleotidase (lipoprotein e(P4) family)
MNARKYLLTGGLVLTSIVSTYFVTVSTAQPGATGAAQQQPVAENDYQLGATLFMQKAAEYRALCFQAFNWARRTLETDEKTLKKLPKAERKKPRAVVVDIDETVLDNSPAQAFGIKNKRPFNQQDWYAWGEMRKAKAIPGAVEFANYARQKGVRIFYVSNRDEAQKQATIDNLKAVGFPDISAENVLLRQTDANNRPVSTKEPRRLEIAKNYRIVILMGDNLNDHADFFERKSVAERFAETDRVRDLWGDRFIVLPNAMYGEWESAIYEYGRLTEPQRAAKRLDSLELP